MVNQSSAIIDAQHKKARLQIQKMIERMGKDEFISFFIDLYKKLNRTVIEIKDVEYYIDHSPKYMTIYLNIMKNEMKEKEM